MNLRQFNIGLIASTLLLYPAAVFSQDIEKESRYERANRLLNPELDTSERARKAIHILTEGRVTRELNDKELSLLCQAYNELTQTDDQLKTAKLLWKRAPHSNEALQWMTNSLHNKYFFADDNQPALEFVERSLKKKQGNRRTLLVFKAQAVIYQRKGITKSQKRKIATQSLIESFKSPPPPLHNRWPDFLHDPNFIDFQLPFCSFFSIEERDKLKQEMANAEKTAPRTKKVKRPSPKSKKNASAK